MELKDLFLTPLYLLLIYGIAFWIRPKVTNKATKKYFIPALTLKLLGAIGLGLVYYFYYKGGDTLFYYKYTRVILDAFYDSPAVGLKLILANGEFDPQTYSYANQIVWYNSPTEYIVLRFGAIFGLIGMGTYTTIALLFAFASFSGMWAMFQTFLKLYPNLHKQFAIAIFFLPSVFFWGSGFMKDSLTIGSLGWLFYGFYMAFIEKKSFLLALIILSLAGYVVATVKIYVLLSFLPPALFWIFSENNRRIKNAFLRNLLKPVFIGVGLAAAVFGATKLTEGNEKYDLNKIGERTKINSEYLTSSMVATGSAYNIGTFDGSIGSMVMVAPQAIVVSLFRPFVWEVRNPVMLLSALEAAAFIYLTLMLFYKTGVFKSLKLIAGTPILAFCMVFSLVLAFAVGTNSGNFGSLVRYKIPLMPFYLSALYIMRYYYLQKSPKRGRPAARVSADGSGLVRG